MDENRMAEHHAFTATLLVLRLEVAALVARGFSTRDVFVDMAGKAFDEVSKMQDEAATEYLERAKKGGR